MGSLTAFDRLARRCARLVDARSFQYVIVGLILANAVVLGLETFEAVEQNYADLLTVLNDVFLGLFTVELALRILAYGRRPQDFFKDGWNVFDFVIIGAAYLPGLRENATALRLVRLLRVVRLVSVIPSLRVIFDGVRRSLAPIATVGVLALMLLFVFGMIGWVLFGELQSFDNIGEAMLTLFGVLTLEGWLEVLDETRAVSDWAVPYFVAFILVGVFVVLNLVIGVVVNAIDEARRVHLEEAAKERGEQAGAEELLEHIQAARAVLDELERRVTGEAPSVTDTPRRPRQPARRP
jgi:voltage-gated sodium channel